MTSSPASIGISEPTASASLVVTTAPGPGRWEPRRLGVQLAARPPRSAISPLRRELTMLPLSLAASGISGYLVEEP
jgi:hypothetical protein